MVPLSLDTQGTAAHEVCQSAACGDTVTTNVKNRYNVYVAPGFQVSDDGLAYVKLGYTGASTGVTSALGTALVNGLTNHAFSYGVGYKQFFNQNIYGYVELDYASHNSGNVTAPTQGLYFTSDIKATSYLVGVGYKF